MSIQPQPRRTFLKTLGVGTLALSTRLTARPIVPVSSRIRAVAFDGFAIFDATRVVATAEGIVPGRGRDLVQAWRARQFEYQWLRTLGGRYADFARTGEDALAVTVKALGISMSREERARLVDAQLTLVPWPDTLGTVRALRDAGVRLAFLSNMTEHMLVDGAVRGGFRDAFDHVLSTDRVNAAKPDPRAYHLALDAFRLPRDQIAFVAFAGWDAIGATWFGYPTVWTNRLALPSDELGAAPARIGRDLGDVVSFVAG